MKDLLNNRIRNLKNRRQRVSLARQEAIGWEDFEAYKRHIESIYNFDHDIAVLKAAKHILYTKYEDQSKSSGRYRNKSQGTRSR